MFGSPSRELPQKIGFVLIPNFSFVAFTGAVEALRLANHVSGKNLYSWSLYSAGGSPVTASNGIVLYPEADLDAARGPGQFPTLAAFQGAGARNRGSDRPPRGTRPAEASNPKQEQADALPMAADVAQAQSQGSKAQSHGNDQPTSPDPDVDGGDPPAKPGFSDDEVPEHSGPVRKPGTPDPSGPHPEVPSRDPAARTSAGGLKHLVDESKDRDERSESGSYARYGRTVPRARLKDIQE